MGEEDPEPNTVNMLLDVSFATNVRYLDEQVSLHSNSVNSRLIDYNWFGALNQKLCQIQVTALDPPRVKLKQTNVTISVCTR